VTTGKLKGNDHRLDIPWPGPFDLSPAGSQPPAGFGGQARPTGRRALIRVRTPGDQCPTGSSTGSAGRRRRPSSRQAPVPPPGAGARLVLDVGPRQHRAKGGIELPARREVVVEGAQLLWPQRGPTSTVMLGLAWYRRGGSSLWNSALQVDQQPGPSTSSRSQVSRSSVQIARTTWWSITSWIANLASGPPSVPWEALLVAQLQAGSGGRWRVGWPHFLVAPLHSSTCRRGNRSDAAKLVRSGCSLHPTATRVRRRPGRVHRRPARERRRDGCGHQRPGPAHRRCGRAGQRLARARPGHLGFGQGCGASGQPGLGRLQRLFGLRARASAARTRASSSALAATRSRWTSWTSSWATSASLRDDDRTRPAGGGTPGRT
jgi:hypothetical protein